MRIGKVPSNVLKRSILKPITPRQAKVRLGAGIGRDASVLSAGEDGAFVLSQTVFEVLDKLSVIAGFYRGVNDLAAAGASPVSLEVTILVPERLREIHVKELMEQLDALCAKEGMEITGGHTTVSEAVSAMFVTLTAVGTMPDASAAEQTLTDILKNAGGEAPAYDKKTRSRYEAQYRPLAGQTLILTGWIGTEGTALLAGRYEEELAARFPGEFLYSAKEMLSKISAVPEAAVAVKHGVTAMHNLSEGGILGGLWEFAERGDVGLDVDLKTIPIRQETVEVCEFLHRNPYQLASNGSLLIAASEPEELLAAFREAQIPAAVIGRTTGGNDRILHNEEEIRYLDRPGMDEIRKDRGEE